jgi:hypothetical protein
MTPARLKGEAGERHRRHEDRIADLRGPSRYGGSARHQEGALSSGDPAPRLSEICQQIGAGKNPIVLPVRGQGSTRNSISIALPLNVAEQQF